jgi:catechol 2,3-dioxygenase
MSVTKLGYASLRSTDLEATISYYTDLIGLRLIDRDSEGRAYLQTVDAQDHHCLVLTKSDRAGLDHAGYKVNDPSDLAEAARALAEREIKAHHVSASTLKGQGEGLRFTAPSGHDFVLFYHADKIDYATGMSNPDPVSESARGGAAHLDHMVVTCEHPWELGRLFCELFGFYVTEQVVAPDGNIVIPFLSCTNTMHDLAVVPGPNGGFHHIAFSFESRSDVIAKADLLRHHHVQLFDYGVSKHGIAGVTTTYTYDPSGNRNELFNGAYLTSGVVDRVPPIIWNPDGMDRGLFYYEGTAPESFSAVT